MERKHRTREQIESDILTQTKVCTKCGLRKPFSEFSKWRTCVDGRHPYCFSCTSKNPEKRNRISRHNRTTEQIQYDISTESKVCNKCGERQSFEMFSKDPKLPDGRHSTCRSCRTKSRNQWRLNNKDRHDYKQRSCAYRKKFNITVEDYDSLLETQGGVCAICGRIPEDNVRFGKVERLSVDHDHDTGNIRGLLCHNCNSAIGFLGDSAENIYKAFLYLGGKNNA